MATVLNTYKVHYHFENAGKKTSPDYVTYLQATAGDYTTLKGVMSSNSLLQQGAFVIDSVQEQGHGDQAKA